MSEGIDRTVYVFVDPAAGQSGVHNLGFVEVLLEQDALAPDCIALGASQQLNQNLREKLAAKGVAVFDAFATHAYRFNNKLPEAAELLPYTMQLAQEYGRLMDQVQSRWPSRRVCFVFHTSPWQHLQALSVAIGQLEVEHLAHWQFHVYLMYWHGCDEAGAVVDGGLYLQFKQTLSRLAPKPGVKFFTSSAAYLKGYEAILAGAQQAVLLHPYFLGTWDADVAVHAKTGPCKKVLAYSGAVRSIKGYDQLVPCVESVLNKFPGLSEVLVHVAQTPNDGEVWQALEAIAKRDPRVVLRSGFLSHEELQALVMQSDLMVLNYERDAYANKTSGFVWMAAQLGIACAVTSNTWLEKECQRLGVPGWRIDDDQTWTQLTTDAPTDQQYRQRILQPYGAWVKQQMRCTNEQQTT